LRGVDVGAADPTTRQKPLGLANVYVDLDTTVRYVPLKKVAGRMKQVPLDCDIVLTGRELGICFGD